VWLGKAWLLSLIAAISLAFLAGSAAGVTAPKGCRGRPVLVVRDGIAVAAVYSAPRGGAGLCALSGSGASGVSERSTASSEDGARVPSAAIQVFSDQMSGAPGLVVLYGRVGTSVTAVTIQRSGHYAAVRARVAHGWYVALWSALRHRTHATTVRITAGSTTRTYPLPAADRRGVPGCGRPPASGCSDSGPGQIVGH
jgi:hypothetical protein